MSVDLTPQAEMPDTAVLPVPGEGAGGASRRVLRAASRTWSFRIGLAVFVLLVISSIVLPMVLHSSATKIVVSDRFLPPVFFEGGKFNHILGTDQLGRDLLLRSLIGLQSALGIGVLSVLLMFIVGCTVGILSGYHGGWADTILMRITDAQLSIPIILLAITVLGVARPSFLTVVLVLVLAGWPIYARLTRSVVVAEREREYVRGARILGASHLRVMALMIAPNVLPAVAFVSILDIARMIIFEAIFGFIGIGIQPPTPTFGNIIADGAKYIVNYWWIPTAPGVFLIVTLTSINMIGASLERERNKVMAGIL